MEVGSSVTPVFFSMIISSGFTLIAYHLTSIGWRVWVRCADRDRRIFLQAGLEISDNFHHRVCNPRVINTHVVLFLQIGEEVDDLRQRVSQRRVIHIILLDKVHLPVPPLDCGQPVSHISRKSFAVGVHLFAEEEI